MSEYLNKQAVLEWLKKQRKEMESECEIDREGAYLDVIEEIQSGVFDADDSEVHRLRAALEKVKEELRWGDAENAIDRVEKIIDQALSTTTEPTGVERVREYYRKLEELRNRTRYRDAAIEYEQRMTDICNVLDFLGITIPGINAPKGEGNDA